MEVDLDKHISEIEFDELPVTQKNIENFLEKTYVNQFDRSLPLWRFYIINGNL